jgi:malto-oligosyltrehalose trehalohydrolase
MRRRHWKPFGCELRDGVCHFTLWGPSIPEITLRIEGSVPMEYPMHAGPGGWHRLSLRDTGPGTLYRFRLPDGLAVPDPASRFNPADVHGPSEVIDPHAFEWSDGNWRGRPWEEAVIYELHIGTFSAEGTFRGAESRLDHLTQLGITAIEIMPVADFPGRRNWGYDGVLPYAPDASYGRPEDFKQLISAAHARGLMVILDVVYNHFGPEGNYLHTYAPAFFNPRRHTPWGAAINFDGAGSPIVRQFFIHNALYWLEEFHLDGLRLDAVHTISDDSSPDIVEDIGNAMREGPGRHRHVHLILENDRNQARYLRRGAHGACECATAQWNDDLHHVLHVIATRESDGYYSDYAARPLATLARCLTEGFAYQGERSTFRGGAIRGEPSNHLPPLAFVDFLQTHDQVGNRAFGERLCHLAVPDALRAVTAILLLAPQPPLLFMGEEFAAQQPFLYFCDFEPDLATAVTEGRRREFARFERFADPELRERIPDPNAAATFERSVLDWTALDRSPHREMLSFYHRLLALRRTAIIPRLRGMCGASIRRLSLTGNVLAIHWRLGDDSTLQLLANLGHQEAIDADLPNGEVIFSTAPEQAPEIGGEGVIAPWFVRWSIGSPGIR